MTIFKNKDDLFKKISFLKGVGPKLTKYLKNKRIEIAKLNYLIENNYNDNLQLHKKYFQAQFW